MISTDVIHPSPNLPTLQDEFAGPPINQEQGPAEEQDIKVSEGLLEQLQGALRRVRIADHVILSAVTIGMSVFLAAFDKMSWLAALAIAALLLVATFLRWNFGWRQLETRIGQLNGPSVAEAPIAGLRPIFEKLPDPILLLDSESRILLSNARAHPLIGGAVDGRHVSSVLRAPGLLEAVGLVLGGAQPQEVEFSSLVPVERHLKAHVAAVPLGPKEMGAQARGAIVLIHDATGQRRLERMRADFVANASHELRTPLASLSGFIETLRGHAKDDSKARDTFLAIMQEQAARMRRLIEDLLSLSRIELNEHVPPEGEVDLADVAGEVIRGLTLQAEISKIRIEANMAAGLAPVIGNRDEIYQVVLNLIDNAMKYGGSGGRIVVSIGTAPPEDRRGSIFNFVSVRDFGDGIPREHLPRLTERFYRVDVPRSRETGGTGLGLAIVKHILNRHRGRLDIESKLGIGSVFTAFFPRVARPESVAQTVGQDAA